MDNQGWKALSSSGSPGRNSPTRAVDYDVQTTFFAAEDSYVPPAPPPSVPGGYTTNLGGNTQVPEVVPAVVPAVTPGSQLQFHDSQLPTYDVRGDMGGSVRPVQAYNGNSNLLGGGVPLSHDQGGPAGTGGYYGWYNLKSYRKYFNVDTMDVVLRMKDSLIGVVKHDFLEKVTDNADLYGPFWIATTLVFLSAVFGNLSNYISWRRHHSGDPSPSAWFYDVDKVGFSTIMFYGYVGFVGFAVWAVLNWVFKGSLTLAQVVCTYGYSLTVFIPISMLCVFPSELLRWLLITAATFTSGAFLMLNFREPIFDLAGARALPLWASMGAAHLGLGLALKLYFFAYYK
eukprot:jgi/Botrbrau1/2285/Bobra.101_2s0108.1